MFLSASLLAGALATSAFAQEVVDFEPSVWDLTLGLHAFELPTDMFSGLACGTNGGPPSLPIGTWTRYAECRADPGTGWHEVYFEYDDTAKYVALATNDQYRIALYAYTSVYSRPVIASALFDADGFMRGLRLVTDTRVDIATRAPAYSLGGFLQARYDGDWQCVDQPPGPGETPYQGHYIRKDCALADQGDGVTRTIEVRLFRRAGQLAINPADNRPTEGYFESSTRFEELLVADIPNRAERLAAIHAQPPQPEDPAVVQARNCPGCDLSGFYLKGADLRGANLAGANLSGAILHGADLSGANLDGANLTNSNLNRAILTRASLNRADLSRAMLYEARLDGALLQDATMILVLAAHARLIGADLSGAVIVDSNLTAIRLTNAIAVGTSFARSRLWDATLSGTDLTGAIFARADLLNIVMVGATLADADLRVSNLTGADLRDADLSRADFSRALMTGAILARARLDGAAFDGAILPAGFEPPT